MYEKVNSDKPLGETKLSKVECCSNIIIKHFYTRMPLNDVLYVLGYTGLLTL